MYHVKSEAAVVQNAHEAMQHALSEALPRRQQMKEMQDAYSDDVLWTR